MEKTKSIEDLRAEHFNTLYTLNLNDKCEKKNNLTYLSWANAWAEFKKVYPSATYRIVMNTETSLPYFVDPNVGVMVFTEVTADELTYQMWLPVLDGAMKPMKSEAYTYQVFDKYKNQYVEKMVEKVSMFDINKTIMRCLVKNLAMFGEGLYIYAGEDIPQDGMVNQDWNVGQPMPEPKTITSTPRRQQPADKYAGIKTALGSVQNQEQLMFLYNQHKNEVDGNNEIKNLFSMRKQQLQTPNQF